MKGTFGTVFQEIVGGLIDGLAMTTAGLVGAVVALSIDGQIAGLDWLPPVLIASAMAFGVAIRLVQRQFGRLIPQFEPVSVEIIVAESAQGVADRAELLAEIRALRDEVRTCNRPLVGTRKEAAIDLGTGVVRS